MTLVIKRHAAHAQNELFGAAKVFLAAKQSPSVWCMVVTKSAKENHFALAMDQNQVVVDTFRGVELKWVFVSRQMDLGYQAHQGSMVQHED
ncbi:hypothetical protein NL676_006314 [Syzygium grande]|nr:hypothetical protein NL676_006314 [Syzygium grande]